MISACRGLHRSELVHSVDVLTVRWPFDLWWMWGDAGWRQGIQITSGGSNTLRSAGSRFPLSRE